MNQKKKKSKNQAKNRKKKPKTQKLNAISDLNSP